MDIVLLSLHCLDNCFCVVHLVCVSFHVQSTHLYLFFVSDARTANIVDFITHVFFILLCTVVTIARAIELKHNANLIAALAFETANFYQKAGEVFI